MLTGKVAIVTGGTRGIGMAIVEKFLQNNATVFLCGSTAKSANDAVEKLKSRNPNCKVSGLGLDLNNPEEIKTAFDKIKSDYGRIDIMVNNAGVASHTALLDHKPDEFKNIIDLNVNAVFNCSYAVAFHMKEQGGGVILNTSSIVSLYGQSLGCGYPTSKFAVSGLTKSLARELGPFNIRVNAVAPGVVNTDMVAALPREIIDPIIATIPLRRVGEKEDIANAFLFLASDNASYISGAILSVDGATVL